MTKPVLSIIVPAYKKEQSIVKDLTSILKVASQIRYPSEVICVIDGMVDRTFDQARSLLPKYPNLRVLGYKTNKGKGHAVRFGMAKSRGKIIAFLDAGMEINPNSLSMILEHFEWYQADIIVGSKRHPASKVNWTPKRKLFSFGYQLVTRVLFGLTVKDTQAGLKCYRRAVLEAVLPRLIVKRYAFDVEILAVANYLGFHQMYEAPIEIDFGVDSSTSAASINHILNMLVDTAAIFYRLHFLHYYDDSRRRDWRFDPELNFRVNTA
jgi:glycosyltransferase involved in cell wall biosynthesis